LISSIQNITHCQHPMILELNSCVWEKIYFFWLNLQEQNTNWSYAALDEEAAQNFSISTRTVRRIRKKLSNVVQTII
jgi:hypothetical protein